MQWNPGPKYQMYLDKIESILTDEKRTVRDVYYALEARGFERELENAGFEDAFEYRYVKRAVKKGRRAGFIDPHLIIDESRRAEAFADEGHQSPRSFIQKHIDGVWNAYEENFWDDQDTYVEVWLEKQSLASVFRPICEEHNVRLEATRGDWSDSKVHEACQRLRQPLAVGDDVKVLYFGDFNPSGLHAPVSVQETMRHYGISIPRSFDESDYFDIWPFAEPLGKGDAGGTIEFTRHALNIEQIREFDLPENPTPSSTDKDQVLRERFMDQASQGRDVNIELNALKEYHRDYLEELVEDAITEHIDDDVREETNERIEESKQKIASAVEVDYSGL